MECCGYEFGDSIHRSLLCFLFAVESRIRRFVGVYPVIITSEWYRHFLVSIRGRYSLFPLKENPIWNHRHFKYTSLRALVQRVLLRSYPLPSFINSFTYSCWAKNCLLSEWNPFLSPVYYRIRSIICFLLTAGSNPLVPFCLVSSIRHPLPLLK